MGGILGEGVGAVVAAQVGESVMGLITAPSLGSIRQRPRKRRSRELGSRSAGENPVEVSTVS